MKQVYIPWALPLIDILEKTYKAKGINHDKIITFIRDTVSDEIQQVKTEIENLILEDEELCRNCATQAPSEFSYLGCTCGGDKKVEQNNEIIKIVLNLPSLTNIQ